MGKKSSSKKLVVQKADRQSAAGEISACIPQPSLSSKLLISLFLVAITLAVYLQVRRFDFVNFDDQLYITENKHTQAGLSWDNIKWAMTTGDASNWHPINWISHMLDVQLFGKDNAGAHHMVNVAFHLLNTLLLFWLLCAATGSLWPSALTAALFAVHPLHVESVAWIAERKDVLSTFFWLLTTAAYFFYAKRPGIQRYLLVAFLFALGLMAKPMLVTLPAALILLDYWPLRRFGDGLPSEKQGSSVFWKLFLEKVPLFAMAAASSVAAYMAQKVGHAVTTLDALPMPLRFGNAIISYLKYLWMTVLPVKMAAFYPHPGEKMQWWQVFASALILLAITAAVFAARKKAPYLITGWFWYVGTLVPVIGIVQVGAQAHADRYTYIPLIGIFFAFSWGMASLAAKLGIPKAVKILVAGALLCPLAIAAHTQASYWRNSIALFEHALKVTEGNYLAHKNLGSALSDVGRQEEAVKNHMAAISYKADDSSLYYNLGNSLSKLNREEEAIAQYKISLSVKAEPKIYQKANYNIGNSLARLGRYEEALPYYTKSSELDPTDPGPIVNKGNTLALLNRPAEAEVLYKRALEIEPENADPLTNLGNVLAAQKKNQEAVGYYLRAISKEPGQVNAHRNLGGVYMEMGKLEEAAAELEKASALAPADAGIKAQLEQVKKAAAQKAAGGKK